MAVVEAGAFGTVLRDEFAAELVEVIGIYTDLNGIDHIGKYRSGDLTGFADGLDSFNCANGFHRFSSE